VVICLERGADLHMPQLMPLPLTVSCFSKIQIGFTFLVPAYPGSPGQRAVKRVCVYIYRPHLPYSVHVCISAHLTSEVPVYFVNAFCRLLPIHWLSLFVMFPLTSYFLSPSLFLTDFRWSKLVFCHLLGN